MKTNLFKNENPLAIYFLTPKKTQELLLPRGLITLSEYLLACDYRPYPSDESWDMIVTLSNRVANWFDEMGFNNPKNDAYSFSSSTFIDNLHAQLNFSGNETLFINVPSTSYKIDLGYSEFEFNRKSISLGDFHQELCKVALIMAQSKSAIGEMVSVLGGELSHFLSDHFEFIDNQVTEVNEVIRMASNNSEEKTILTGQTMHNAIREVKRLNKEHANTGVRYAVKKIKTITNIVWEED